MLWNAWQLKSVKANDKRSPLSTDGRWPDEVLPFRSEMVLPPTPLQEPDWASFEALRSEMERRNP